MSDKSYKTGDTCPTLGRWKNDCSCDKELAITSGEAFPVCPGCHGETRWQLAAKVELNS